MGASLTLRHDNTDCGCGRHGWRVSVYQPLGAEWQRVLGHLRQLAARLVRAAAGCGYFLLISSHGCLLLLHRSVGNYLPMRVHGYSNDDTVTQSFAPEAAS